MIMKNSDNQKLIHDINLIMNRLNAIKTNIKIIDDYDEKLSIIINNDVEDIKAKVNCLGDVLDVTVEYVELKHYGYAD
jgi:hypothetical protein